MRQSARLGVALGAVSDNQSTYRLLPAEAAVLTAATMGSHDDANQLEAGREG
jgi:hypothetical protein